MPQISTILDLEIKPGREGVLTLVLTSLCLPSLAFIAVSSFSNSHGL